MREKVRYLSIVLLVFFVVFCATYPIFSQEPPVRIRVARLIERLGAPSYVARQSADDELARLGAVSRKQLEVAAESTDPETRLRARRLLKKLATEALWRGSLVQLPSGDMQASDAVAALAKQTGNKVTVGDQYGTFHDVKIRLDHPQSTFWPVVDELCRSSGNRFRPHYSRRRSGLVFVAGDLGKYPLAYAGPVRGQIVSARRVFVEELDYQEPKSETSHNFQFNLSLAWEDQFRLVAHRTHLEVAEAVADGDAKIFDTGVAQRSWSVVTGETHQWATTLQLRPPPRAARRLKHLTLRWGVIAVTDFATLDVADLAAGAVGRHHDLRLTVEKVEQPSNMRWEISLAISRDLVVPEPKEILYHENDFELLDAAGKPFESQGRTGVAIHGNTAQLKLAFSAPSAESKPHLLRVRYPRIRDQRDLTIRFVDVPLPVALPE